MSISEKLSSALSIVQATKSKIASSKLQPHLSKFTTQYANSNFKPSNTMSSGGYMLNNSGYSNRGGNSATLNQISNAPSGRQIYSGDPSSVNFGVSGNSYNPEPNMPGAAIPNSSMLDCPTEIDGQGSEAFVDYGKPLGSAAFHCGYDGIKEDRTPTGPGGIPQQECFYDENGALVDENHEYAECGGSPNQYDADANPWDHTVNDSGGIVSNGLQGLGGTIHHGFDNAVDAVQEGFSNTVDAVQESFDNLVDKFTGGDSTDTPAPAPTPTPSTPVTEHKSSADERQEEADRNSAGHANPGSDAGTEELSGYAG